MLAAPMSEPTGTRRDTEAASQHERAAQLPRDLPHDLHVLVVDDHGDTLDLLSSAVREFGATVLRSRSAKHALTIINTAHIDVLVSDLAMPGEDGLWLIQQSRVPALWNCSTASPR